MTRIADSYYKGYSSFVGKTKRHQQAIYLDKSKADLLDKLSKETGIPKQYYFREGVDLVLRKHGLLKPKRKP